MISLHHTITLDGLPATAARDLLHAADLVHSLAADLAYEAGSPAPARGRFLDARVTGVEDTATSHRAVGYIDPDAPAADDCIMGRLPRGFLS
jgi:hypothetical protein